MEILQYLKVRYEKEFNEPYSALEARVRSRHKEFFEMLDVMEAQEE